MEGHKAVKKPLTAGVVLIVLGLVAIILFSILPIYLGDNRLILWGIRAAIALLVAGSIVIISFLIVERLKDKEKLKKEIDKKDLRP